MRLGKIYFPILDAISPATITSGATSSSGWIHIGPEADPMGIVAVVSAGNLNSGTLTPSWSQAKKVPVQASTTITLTSAVSSKTITINDVVFTAGTDFSVAGDNTADAHALAAAINASEDAGIYDIFRADHDGNVVTVTVIDPGIAGNSYTISSNDASMVVGNTSAFAGGLDYSASKSLTVTGEATALSTNYTEENLEVEFTDLDWKNGFNAVKLTLTASGGNCVCAATIHAADQAYVP